MAAPILPSVEQLVDLFMAELPEGMFALDRADALLVDGVTPDPSRISVSSADIRAQMTLLAVAYANLTLIYFNKFAQNATDDTIGRWEKQVFGVLQDSSQPLSVRVANVVAQISSNAGISGPAIETLLTPLFANASLAFSVAPWNGTGGEGGWILGQTALGAETYVNKIDPNLPSANAPLTNALDYAASGLTLAQLQDIQAVAYTYDVRIYGNADSTFLAKLDVLLTRIEPARSAHNVLNNCPLPP